MNPQTKQTALSAFVAECNRADDALARLRELSMNHYGTHPDSVTWGDVGSVAHVATLLEQALNHFNPNRED
jgi:hypothetical protein